MQYAEERDSTFEKNLVHAELTDLFLKRAAKWLRSYFRIEVEGLENVPATGPALVAPNHSGFAAFDAIMIAHLLHQDRGRVPKILAHKAFFDWFDFLRRLSIAFGLEEVSVSRGVDLLKRNELVMVFPEGESGNFKPSTLRYHLQRFHSGFVRMAAATSAPVVPCLVIGAEESHLCLGNLDFSSFHKGLKLPLPLNLFPLPSKWKIKFLKPVHLTAHEHLREVSVDIQIMMQRELNHELLLRKYVYFPDTSP